MAARPQAHATDQPTRPSSSLAARPFPRVPPTIEKREARDQGASNFWLTALEAPLALRFTTEQFFGEVAAEFGEGSRVDLAADGGAVFGEEGFGAAGWSGGFLIVRVSGLYPVLVRIASCLCLCLCAIDSDR